MYITKQHVDYITFTTSKFKRFDDVIGEPEPCRPLIGNYSSAHIYPTGMVVQWNKDKPSLKTHITMTGKTLDNMRTIGFTESEIIEHLQSMQRANFKRIDLAITSHKKDGSMHGFLPHFAHFATLSGWCNTKLTLDKPVTDVNLNIETAYIGKRKQREYLRVYDKGLELGGLAGEIIRIELERHSVANTIARDVANGIPYGQVINRYISFPNSPDWNEIVGTVAAPRTRVDIDKEKNEKKENDRLWSWLFNSVAPAMAKALYNEDCNIEDSVNADRFSSLVAEHYNRLVDKNLI